MPTFSSFGAFERELANLERDIDLIEKKRMTKAQAGRAQEIATQAFSAKLGGDPKFSGWAPTLDTQTKSLSSGGALLTPTKTGAGPITVAFEGRNQGTASGVFGPGVMRSGRTSKRIKAGGTVKAFKAKRWNGYTRSKVDPDALRDAIEKAAQSIAEDHARKATQRHFDVR